VSPVASKRETPFDGLTVLADDDPRWDTDPIACTRAACEGGAAVVQLRAKHATDTQTLRWSESIRSLTRAHGVHFFVNDRFDLALAAGADGVHLGQDDLPPHAIPEAFRKKLWIGRSSHTLDEARAAKSEPIDYLAFGPIFGTTSKDSAHAERGLALLSDVVRLVAPLPVIGIGGVDASNAAAVASAGARGVAVISAVSAAEDPTSATRAIVDVLAGGHGA